MIGCFAWDPDGHIRPQSPFPNRIYFILSLPRFIEIFGSIQKITEKLVWLPTRPQARLLCRKLEVDASRPGAVLPSEATTDPAEELAALYSLFIKALGG